MAAQSSERFPSFWQSLVPVLTRILVDPYKGPSIGEVMDAYTIVYNYCLNSPRELSELEKKEASKITVTVVPENATGQQVRGSMIFDATRTLINEYLLDMMVKSFQSSCPKEFVSSYCKYWVKYLHSIRYLRQVLDYVTRIWMPQSSPQKPKTFHVDSMAYKCWRHTVFNAIEHRLINALIKYINIDRSGNPVDHRVIRSVLKSFLKLDFNSATELSMATSLTENRTHNTYRKCFEEVFCAQTLEYYRMESTQLLASLSLVDYVNYTVTRIEEELHRASKCLLPESHVPLSAIMQSAMVLEHGEKFKYFFVNLITENKHNEMKVVYDMLGAMPELLAPLYSAFEVHLRDYGKDLVASKIGAPLPSGSPHPVCSVVTSETIEYPQTIAVTDLMHSTVDFKDAPHLNQPGALFHFPSAFVSTVLDLVTTFDNIVTVCLKGDAGFRSAFDHAIRVVINHPYFNIESIAPECITRTIDGILKRFYSKSIEKHDCLAKIEHLLKIFKFLPSAEPFQEVYSKFLFKRVMTIKKLDSDLEFAVFKSIREQLSADFLSKADRIISARTTEENQPEFLDFLFTNKETKSMLNNESYAPPPDILEKFYERYGILPSVVAIGLSYFPFVPEQCTVKMPPELDHIASVFHEYYDAKYDKRQVTWAPLYSTCKVRAEITPGGPVYELTTSIIQAIILKLFNETRRPLNFGTILQNTCDNPIFVQGSLDLLIKANLIIASPSGFENITRQSTLFTLNTAFYSDKKEINLIAPLTKLSYFEPEQSTELSAEQRKTRMRSMIAFKMKQMKRLSKGGLFKVLRESVADKFTPTASEFAEVLDDLIERDFLAYTEGTMDTLDYKP